ncbi:hypothetical protein AK36_3147 [Burkholderia vietnamiensis LMG 10929]|nr:hypothetical protein AK36_3147 [Burkholderia vietnamiensis LMG 10929]
MSLARWMLEHGEPKARDFLEQLAEAEVTPWRCPCGCGSINFQIKGRDPAPPGVHVLGDFIFGPHDEAAAKAHPSNTDKSQIIGKLMLIGRTYSASVERRKTKGLGKDERHALEVVIEAATAIAGSKCATLLDAIGLDDKLTLDRVPEAAAIHLELCQALATANNRENSSLASKYLHFHRPAFFPIVDSIVREGWSWVMDDLEGSYKGWRDFGKVARYKDWCARVLELRDLMEDNLRHAVSLRQIDSYLLSIMSVDGQGGLGLPQ